MSLEIQQHEHEGIAILDLDGRLTVGSEASAFREKISALMTAATAFVMVCFVRIFV